MKTPHLDAIIESLEALGIEEGRIAEYKAIKKQLETNPIVSTPENPVWVVDENGNKRILLADFGEKCRKRHILVYKDNSDDFLNDKKFDWSWASYVTSYTEKVSIEVTEDEAVKVEEFLKGLRNETN